jgi:hypothetical protein
MQLVDVASHVFVVGAQQRRTGQSRRAQVIDGTLRDAVETVGTELFGIVQRSEGTPTVTH